MAETTAEQTYRIRALEWEEKLAWSGRALYWIAYVPDGYYKVLSCQHMTLFSDALSPATWMRFNNSQFATESGNSPTDAAAKLAAEAHWRATILPALEAV